MMENQYYYFYDRNEVLIDRYPVQISKRIKELEPDSLFVYIYSERLNGEKPKKVPKGSVAIFLPFLGEKEILKLTKIYPPKSLTVIALRIPDLWLISLFNNLNIKTNTVQHGLWSDKLVRVPLPSLFFYKFIQILKYLYYSKQISKLNDLSFLKVLKDFYDLVLKENKNFDETRCLDSSSMRAGTVFAFDYSWEEYYLSKYGYNKEQLIFIGNPDLLLLKNLVDINKENSICYLCQSLVEDGRLDIVQYQEFLLKMVRFLPADEILYIKLHPRSRMNIYSPIMNRENVVFTNDLPKCEFYIGHYTGLLATVKYISQNILIWLFDGHHTPPYFKKFGSIVTSRDEDLVDFINGKGLGLNSGFDVTCDIDFKKFDPIKTIAQNLIRA